MASAVVRTSASDGLGWVGDPISMLLLMLPQFVLCGVGIDLSAKSGQTPLWRREELDAT